jgi:hypothetical protein
MTESNGATNIAVSFSSNDGKDAVVIEDDGRVGYAYLLNSDGRICGDVPLAGVLKQS